MWEKANVDSVGCCAAVIMIFTKRSCQHQTYDNFLRKQKNINIVWILAIQFQNIHVLLIFQDTL